MALPISRSVTVVRLIRPEFPRHFPGSRNMVLEISLLINRWREPADMRVSEPGIIEHLDIFKHSMASICTDFIFHSPELTYLYSELN